MTAATDRIHSAAHASARGQLQSELLAFLRRHPERWTAPYGILDSVVGTSRGAYRSITFGIARYLDAEIRIYSPTYILLRSSRTGTRKFTSVAELRSYLTDTTIP